jgi:ATP-dependent protease ClpP protease subunit
MHNIGVVASAGVFVFLGAQYRTCHSEALFLMHRHFWALDEATKIDSKDISELHLVSNAIRERSLSILQRQLGANREIAERLSSESRIIGADEAKSLGIVHNIERTSIPTGPALFHIPSDP